MDVAGIVRGNDDPVVVGEAGHMEPISGFREAVQETLVFQIPGMGLLVPAKGVHDLVSGIRQNVGNCIRMLPGIGGDDLLIENIILDDLPSVLLVEDELGRVSHLDSIPARLDDHFVDHDFAFEVPNL